MPGQKPGRCEVVRARVPVSVGHFPRVEGPGVDRFGGAIHVRSRIFRPNPLGLPLGLWMLVLGSAPTARARSPLSPPSSAPCRPRPREHNLRRLLRAMESRSIRISWGNWNRTKSCKTTS